MIRPGERVLVTTNNWFRGPDGRDYNAVWGTVLSINSDEQTLGIKTNARATNWYAVIGNMTIAGCQIYYAIRCDVCPPAEAEGWETKDGVCLRYTRPTNIYNADA